MKFNLTIEMGNDAMLSPGDLAGALKKLSKKIDQTYDTFTGTEMGKIQDLNGQPVGTWEVTDDRVENGL